MSVPVGVGGRASAEAGVQGWSLYGRIHLVYLPVVGDDIRHCLIPKDGQLDRLYA